MGVCVGVWSRVSVWCVGAWVCRCVGVWMYVFFLKCFLCVCVFGFFLQKIEKDFSFFFQEFKKFKKVNFENSPWSF